MTRQLIPISCSASIYRPTFRTRINFNKRMSRIYLIIFVRRRLEEPPPPSWPLSISNIIAYLSKGKVDMASGTNMPRR